MEQFLRSLGYSKHVIIHLRRTSMGLTIAGELVYTTHKLKCGEVLSVLLEEEASENIVPTCMPLDIVFEDRDIMVINKASNTPIHPSQGNFYNTLANGIAYYTQSKGEAMVYRAINRLDRDTTGLLILAKHQLSACILSDMVKTREIHREYMAVVGGQITEGGTVTAPIARVDGSTIERCVDKVNGEYACTHYQPVTYNQEHNCTLLTLKLETGRTHQIRVHMAWLGHPLLGDFLYNPENHQMDRQALHSFRLSFIHPITKEPLAFTAELPDDMKQILVTI